jgi:hypothetical protein
MVEGKLLHVPTGVGWMTPWPLGNLEALGTLRLGPPAVL